MSKVTCAICGKSIEKEDAVIDNGCYLCKECDIEQSIERLPDKNSTATFKVTKRICASTKGMQFLTSGYPNRSKWDKRKFCSMDGLFSKGLLPDLQPNETDFFKSDGKPDPRQGIEVDVYISRVEHEGWHKMWVYGTRAKSRLLTPNEPKNVRRDGDSTRALLSGGAMYVDTWCEKDYFPYMEDDAKFPVFVKVTRKGVQP